MKNSDFVRNLGAGEFLAYNLDSLDSASKFEFMMDTLDGEAYGEALKLMKPKAHGGHCTKEDEFEFNKDERLMAIFTVNLKRIRTLMMGSE